MSAMIHVPSGEEQSYDWAVIQWDYRKEGHRPKAEPEREEGWHHMWSCIETEGCFGVYRKKKA